MENKSKREKLRRQEGTQDEGGQEAEREVVSLQGEAQMHEGEVQMQEGAAMEDGNGHFREI
jgi:hypothetical protein